MQKVWQIILFSIGSAAIFLDYFNDAWLEASKAVNKQKPNISLSFHEYSK
jgi:hypothetical protein